MTQSSTGPDVPAAEAARRAAGAAWRRRAFPGYFRLMRQATDLDPTNPATLLDLAAAHGGRAEYADAERCLERAVAVSIDRAGTLAVAGLQCRNFLRYDWAERYLARAAAEPGASADTLAKLAEMRERQRDAVGAADAVDRALAISRENPLALLVVARLHRSAGRLDEAERVVRSFLDKADPEGWSTRVRGWYELAAILDRQGQYDEAFAALTTAKRMVLPNAARAVDEQGGVQRRLAEAAATGLTAEQFRRWAGAAADPSPRPFAVLAGHPRSGTTLLEQLLDAHSSVVSAEETALFFDTYLDLRRDAAAADGMAAVLAGASASTLRRARAGYFERVDRFVGDGGRGKLLVDKNPSLTALIPAVVRVVPQARIIVAVRDPRDVCLSCLMQPLPINPVSSMFLTVQGTVDEYRSLMGFWLAVRTRLATPWLEVRYEDVVADVAGQAGRALSFLGLAWEPGVLGFDRIARQKLVRSPTYAEVARPVSAGAIGRWRHYRKHLEPHLAALAPMVRAFGYDPE